MPQKNVRGSVRISYSKAVSPYSLGYHRRLCRVAIATPDLPSQPHRITARRPVPNYTAWQQRHVHVNELPGMHMSESASSAVYNRHNCRYAASCLIMPPALVQGH